MEYLDFHRVIYDSYISVKEKGIENVDLSTAAWYEFGSKKSRDSVFYEVFKVLDKKPLRVLEIGTSRSLDLGTRLSDGWSTMFWCDYIEKYGGKIVTCDIGEGAIDNCRKLTQHFTDKIEIEYYLGDGEELINDSFNFYYLDGADDGQAAHNQFKKIDRTRAHILCDDFHSVKGAILIREEPDFEPLVCGTDECPHALALYKRLGLFPTTPTSVRI